MDYNLILTSFRGEQRELLHYLKGKGDFHRTNYRDVIIGFVDDVFKLINELEEDTPLCLSRAVILNETFKFTNKESLINELKSRVLNYSAKLSEYKSFRVTVERRGHKGELNSHEMEKDIGGLLFEHLKAKEAGISVDLSNPDIELIIEVMEDSCGIGLITKELRDKYPFIKS